MCPPPQASWAVYNAFVERQTKPAAAPTPPERFEVAQLDPYARRLTIGLAYLGGLLMLPLLFAYLANLRWDGLLIPVALALAVAIFLLLTFASQPRRYELSDDALLIRRRLWRPVKVPLETITAAASAAALADVPRRGLRFAFNAGIFGYQGPFRLAPYGEVFFLATDRARLVTVARLGRPPLILSPERPRAFIEAVNTRRTRLALGRLEETGDQGAATRERATPPRAR
jgi:Bacterial PH domain